MRAPTTPTLIALTILLLATLVPTPATAQDGVQVEVKRLSGTYGPEGWKDINATLGKQLSTSPVPTIPTDATGTYANPYHDPARPHAGPGLNWLGYKLTAHIELQNSEGEPLGSGNYIVDAKLQTATGTIPVKITKLSTNQFRLELDLDGENGKPWPGLSAGGQGELEVDVYRIPDGPATQPQFVGSRSITFDGHRGSATPVGVPFPEAELPGYDDATLTNFTPLLLTPAPPGTPITATVHFPGAANEPARVLLHHGTSVTELARTNTDANGTLQVTFDPADGLSSGADTGLLLLEAHLTGVNRALGSTAVAITATPHRSTVASIQPEDRDIQETSTVQVTVTDPNPNPQNTSRQGVLHLMNGATVFHTTRFDPGSFTQGEHRTARYPASAVREDGYASYQVVAFLFDEANDVYSLATAQRGVRVSPLPGTVQPNERGEFHVRVENLNDNGNAQIDSGLLVTVEVEVEGLPGTAGTVTDQVVVPERGVKTLGFPFTASTAGTHSLQVNATSGEIQQALTSSLRVTEEDSGPLSLDRLRDIPAVGAPALLAALILAGLMATRRPRT